MIGSDACILRFVFCDIQIYVISLFQIYPVVPVKKIFFIFANYASSNYKFQLTIIIPKVIIGFISLLRFRRTS